MLDLQAGEHQVQTPQEVVEEQRFVLAEPDALLRWHDEASVDVDPDDEEGIEDQLDSYRVLRPVPFQCVLAGLCLPIVLASAVQHSLKHHHEHER